MTRIQRGHALLGAHRPEAALEEFLLALAEDPHDYHAHIGCAACHLALERWEQAALCAQKAIAVAPEHDSGFGCLAEAEIGRKRWSEATAAALEALRIDSDDPENHGRLARTFLGRSLWAEALAAADAGLAVDPENETCSNARSVALLYLGRVDAAAVAASETLRFAPESSHSHMTRGLTALHEGRHRDARRHFQEALRLAPENEAAREGLVLSIKATWPVYRWWVDGALWYTRLGWRAQSGLIVGGYVLARILRAYASAHPEADPWVVPVLVAYGAFVAATWIANPLANVILLAHPVGRHALTRDARREAILVGSLLVAGVSLAVTGWQMPDVSLLISGFVCLGLVFPVVVFHGRERGSRSRIVVAVWGALLALLGATVVALHATAAEGDAGDAQRLLATTSFTVFVFAAVATSWLTLVFLFGRRPR